MKAILNGLAYEVPVELHGELATHLVKQLGYFLMTNPVIGRLMIFFKCKAVIFRDPMGYSCLGI